MLEQSCHYSSLLSPITPLNVGLFIPHLKDGGFLGRRL